MGLLDKLLGRETRQQHDQYGQAPGAAGGSWSTPGAQTSPQGQPFQGSGGGAGSEDERAVARYRYLLRTAPPESLEQVHAEAFERLTPEQRQSVRLTLRSPRHLKTEVLAGLVVALALILGFLAWQLTTRPVLIVTNALVLPVRVQVNDGAIVELAPGAAAARAIAKTSGSKREGVAGRTEK